ncbi:hypothetical protein V9K67_07985 [Paraflavisolibacter sp. H34]|uniref:GumC family protein n=1 Tax=Huijunlia imazamoxiresistens TaxID=3127457 RepID=UPI003018EB10
MSFIQFIRIVVRNLKWLLLVPLVLSFSIYYFTRHQKKSYSSETVIYTGIASGYTLNQSSDVNYLSVSNAFDNLLTLINSRETRQEVALQLLAEHLTLPRHEPAVLSWDTYSSLKQLVPDTLRARLAGPTADETFEKLSAYLRGSNSNAIYRLLHSDAEFYSVNALKNSRAQRISSSDLIQISYETSDPAVCKRTLELLVAIFMRKQLALKEGQTESAVAYFERQTRDAYARLDSAERQFLDFSKNNEIINYVDQTRAVAVQRENLYSQGHDIEMDEKAAERSLEKMDENIRGRIYQSTYGTELIRGKEQLADLYSKIALSETMTAQDGGAKRLDSLKHVAAGLERKMDGTMDKLYEKSNTPNGIPTREVLDEWLQASLAYERNKAKLSVMDKRKREFDTEYRKYAPLGATLKKIERQIGVTEREYLDYLHSLSQARMTQQSNKLSGNLTIVDPPFLPLKPNASKRMLLVAVGFVAGFALVLAVVLARFMLNRTLRDPKRAAAVTGLSLMGLYPLKSAPPAFLARAQLRLLQQLLSKVHFTETPVRIGFISTQEGEGKSTLIDLLHESLSERNYKVEKLQWTRDGLTGRRAAAEIELVEFPALETVVIGPNQFPHLHGAYLVCRANRVWVRNDKDLLAIFTRTTGLTPSFILNGVEKDFAEEYIGDVPKKRFRVRTAAKRLFRFEFGGRSAFSGK